MKFTYEHNNINVLNLEKSLRFYEEALGLTEVRRVVPENGDFIIVFLSDGTTSHLVELTWLKNWDKPYDLGDNEFHMAFRTDDFENAYEKHKEMGCICYENKEMGLYFINDPDDYWIEILPAGK